MNKQRLDHLIEKVLSGEASGEEKAELDDWYRLKSQGEAIWPKKSETSGEVKRRILAKIDRHVQGAERNTVPLYRKKWAKVAAAVLIIFSTSVYLFLNSKKQEAYQVADSISNTAKIKDNRYIVLPDSSTILLHTGSSISYRFSSSKRELTLNGEAYFDIRHQSRRPFIIHTGRVKTTVLGTAFNIKAYPGQQVTVSVARGKVSVEDQGKNTLVLLTPGSQISAGTTKAQPVRQVDVQSVTKWVGYDMQFNDLPFTTLAQHLEHRYGVKIQFTNARVAQCRINGRFDGLEPLNDVLTSLTQSVGADFTIVNKEITIDGKGCGSDPLP